METELGGWKEGISGERRAIDVERIGRHGSGNLARGGGDLEKSTYTLQLENLVSSDIAFHTTILSGFPPAFLSTIFRSNRSSEISVEKRKII